MHQFLELVRRKYTGVCRVLLAYGIKLEVVLQPFALITVLFTKPVKKGSFINNR